MIVCRRLYYACSIRGIIVIDEKEILVEGEKRLGRYTVVLLQQSASQWFPSTLQLDAVVTNFRLLLRPLRKKYTPASLPSTYIKTIKMTKKAHYNVIAMELITQHMLYAMVSSGKLDDLYDQLSVMHVGPPKIRFDEKVARRDIERLITFFDRVDII